jgi:hypothetical protein
MTKIFIKDNKFCIEKSLDEKIVGLIVHGGQWINGEYGFAYEIDRSYKGKDPDVSTFFYKCDDIEDEKDFINLCNNLNLSIYTIHLNQKK